MMRIWSFHIHPTVRLLVVGCLALATLLLLNALPSEAVVATGAPAVYQDGFSGDIFGPSTIYGGKSLCCIYRWAASYFPRLPTNGVPRGSLQFPPDHQNMFSLGGANGFSLLGQGGIYQYNGPNEISFNLTVTDGYSTIVKPIKIIWTDNVEFFFGGNFVLDSNPGSNNVTQINEISVGAGSVGFTAKFSTDKWRTDGGSWITTAAAWPLASHWGRTDVTATTSGGDVRTFPLYITHEHEAIIDVHWTQTLYSNLPATTTVAQMSSFCDGGIKQITSADTANLFVISSSGYISINKPLSVGANQIWNLQVESNSGKKSIFPIKYTVLAGTTLPSSAISLTQLPIDNYRRTQDVGQPIVTGFKPTLWTLKNRNNGNYEYYDGPMNLFVINSTTGFVKTGSNSMVPARTHKVTITATDGPNYVERTFDIVCSPKIGPTWHVGRNMSKVYPGQGFQNGRGFETLAEVLSGVLANKPNLDEDRAGYKVIIHYDADFEYYTNDNGLRTNDDGLRFGWLGPGTIESADPNGPRPRLGGGYGTIDDGYDRGAKGFFNLGNGDFTIRGLDISWCNGWGAPDNGLINGMSCIRKNAGTWGDLVVENCYIHDNNNGIESGGGAFDVYVRNSVFGNSGTQYVSSGATHANYLGANSYIELTNNLYYQTINGHNLKIRAMSGLIKGNRIYDGERGGASSQIDLSNGGDFIIEDNYIMKGPNAQSYSAILFAAESTGDRPQGLIIRNNRIMCTVPNGNHYGATSAISIAHVNFRQYAPKPFLVANNQFFLGPYDKMSIDSPYGDGGYPYPATEFTNNTILQEPFRLDFTDPGTANPPAARLGFIPWSYDGNYGNFKNFDLGMQIESGTDDMRVWVNAPVGTVVGRCKAATSPWWSASGIEEHRAYANAYKTGTKWRLVPDATAFYGDKIVVAPPQRFLIDADTGVITVGKMANATSFPRLEYIVVEAQPKDGPLSDKVAWFRFYVTTTSLQDKTTLPVKSSSSSSSGSASSSSSGPLTSTSTPSSTAISSSSPGSSTTISSSTNAPSDSSSSTSSGASSSSTSDGTSSSSTSDSSGSNSGVLGDSSSSSTGNQCPDGSTDCSAGVNEASSSGDYLIGLIISATIGLMLTHRGY